MYMTQLLKPRFTNKNIRKKFKSSQFGGSKSKTQWPLMSFGKGFKSGGILVGEHGIVTT